MPDRDPLTLDQLHWLSDLLRGVERNAPLRWMPSGADGPTGRYVLRAFTHKDGNFPRSTEDVRDLFVWVSGVMEHWLPVMEVIAALNNATYGTDGFDKPMAIIDKE